MTYTPLNVPREKIQAITSALRHLPLFSTSSASDPDGEVRLYLQRALRAASEERFDVAIVFCEKAIELAPGNLGARLLVARLYAQVDRDVHRAVAGYRKVITLAGYDSRNAYCAAAREGLDALVEEVSSKQ